MSDSRAAEKIREWGRAMGEAMTELEDGLLHCEEYYSGPAGKGYNLQCRHVGDDNTFPVQYNNDGERQLTPSVGQVVPANSTLNGGSTDVVIVSFEEYTQPEAEWALEHLEKTKESANALDKLTQEDADDLCSLPEALAQSIEGLAAVSRSLNLGAEEVDRLTRELVGSAWRSEGREAYKATIGQQAKYFRSSRDDAERIIEGNIEVVKLIEDLVETMMNIAQARRDSATELITDMLSLIDPVTWAQAAGRLVEKANDWKKDQQEDLKQKLQDLAKSAEALNVLDSIERTMVQQWPAAAGGLTGGPGRPDPEPSPPPHRPGQPIPAV